MGERSPSDLSLATMEDLMKELKLWKERGQSLRQLVQQFFEHEKAFSVALSDKVGDPNMALLSKSVKAIVSLVQAHPAAILPFFGQNSSGKSTLLNALLGGYYMPSGEGHVTGRICAIAWGKMEEAKIILTTLEGLNSGNYSGCTVIPISGASEEGVKGQLSLLLKRVDEEMKDEDLERWISTVVLIQYPFPLLESGMMLVDLPGKSDADNALIQAQLAKYFISVRPAGVCFVYDNPSFSDGASMAYDFLTEALDKTKDANVDPEIFFISRFAYNNVHFDQGLGDGVPYTHAIFDKVIQKQWNLLQTARNRMKAVDFQISSNVDYDDGDRRSKSSTSLKSLKSLKSSESSTSKKHHISSSYESDLNFGACNALDYLSILNNQFPDDPVFCEFEDETPEAKSRLIFAEFRRRLFTFSVLVQRVRYETVYSRLLDGSAQFFRIYNAHKSKNGGSVLEMAKQAMDSVDDLRVQLVRAAHSAISDIPNTIKALSEEEGKWESIWSAAKEASSEFNGKPKSMHNALIECIRAAISPQVKALVIDPMVDILERRLNSSLEAVILERMEQINRNQILSSAMRGSIIVDSIQFYNAGIMGTMLSRFIRTLQKVRRGAVVLTILASPLLATMAICGAVADWVSSIKEKVVHQKPIDDDFRKDVTRRLFNTMIGKISPDDLQKAAESDINNLILSIKENIIQESNSITIALNRLENNDSALRELSSKFATYECECWVELRNLEGSLAPIQWIDQSSISSFPSSPTSSSPTPSSSNHPLNTSSIPNQSHPSPSNTPGSDFSQTTFFSPSPSSSRDSSPPHSIAPASSSAPRPHSENCRLINAQWKGMNVLVKKPLVDRAAGDMLRLFMEDAHYSLYIRRLAAESNMPPSILPALAIHRHRYPDHRAEYFLIYDDCEGDLEQLFEKDGVSSVIEDGKSAISKVDRLYFCLQAAMGVAWLHQCNVAHGKVIPRSLWYRKSGSYYIAYLTDFALATTSTITMNLSGAKNRDNSDWTPPEARKGSEKQSEAAGSVGSSNSIHSRVASNGSIGSTGSSSSTSTPNGTRQGHRRHSERQSYSGKPFDIWMLAKTILFFLNTNDASFSNISNSPLIKSMLDQEPQKRPTAESVVDQLRLLILENLHTSYPLPSESPLYQLLFCSLASTDPSNANSTSNSTLSKIPALPPPPSRQASLIKRESFYNASPASSTIIPRLDGQANASTQNPRSSTTSPPPKFTFRRNNMIPSSSSSGLASSAIQTKDGGNIANSSSSPAIRPTMPALPPSPSLLHQSPPSDP